MRFLPVSSRDWRMVDLGCLTGMVVNQCVVRGPLDGLGLLVLGGIVLYFRLPERLRTLTERK